MFANALQRHNRRISLKIYYRKDVEMLVDLKKKKK